MIERIEDIEGNPVLRRLYNVPVAVVQLYNENGMIRKVPVFDAPHTDPQFSEYQHYHVDARFTVPPEVLEVVAGRTNQPVWVNHPSNSWKFLRIERAVMPCRHKTCGLNNDQTRPLAPESWKKFYRPFLGKKCHGKKCPHWGMVMQEHKNGLWECPMHGLQARNEVIIKPEGNWKL